MIKDPVPKKHIITPPTCTIVGCDNPCHIRSAYNKGQKYRKICHKHHKQRLDELKREREERERSLSKNTLDRFWLLKKFYTLRQEESENSVINHLKK